MLLSVKRLVSNHWLDCLVTEVSARAHGRASNLAPPYTL